MKKLLKIAGILLIILGILALLFAVMWWYACNYTMDGSAGLYAMQHRNMLLSLAAGAVLAAGGVACLIARRRI